MSLAEALDRLQNSREIQSFNPQAALIQARAEQVLTHPTFQDSVAGLHVTTADFVELRPWLAKIYRGFQNFSLLHGMTSAQALAGLLDFVADKDQVLSTYVQSLLAVYVSIGMPRPASQTIHVARQNWDEIARAAIRSKDDHIIKLVFTARIEFEHFHDEVYQQIAWMMASGNFHYAAGK